VLDRTREADLTELREYTQREDIENYEPVLREVLVLFGTAIHTSLERTMGKYLRSTGGIYRNELRSDWELQKVAQLLSHNNAAERPFAIAKAYLKSFPTMKLSCLDNFALALTNGTHRPAGTQEKTIKTKVRATPPAGIAFTSPEVLKVAVTKLCEVRTRIPVTVTQLLRDLNAGNVVREDELRRANQIAELDRKVRTKTWYYGGSTVVPVVVPVFCSLPHT
jgi:hypothetical protein